MGFKVVVFRFYGCDVFIVFTFVRVFRFIKVFTVLRLFVVFLFFVVLLD